MHYTFEPNEFIENILHILDSLQDRWNDAEVSQRPVWESAITRQLENLNNFVQTITNPRVERAE